MQDGFESPLPSPEKEPPGILRHPAVIALATLLSIAALYLLFFRGPAPVLAPSTAQKRLPFGDAERMYASKLRFGNFEMSRAENFLNQEVTYLAGDVLNSGDRALTGIEVVVQFQDDMNQIALRENRPVLFGPTALLAPGKRAHFEISFDHVPPSWNMQLPSVQVSGLQFALSEK
jgi:hypothetical protein